MSCYSDAEGWWLRGRHDEHPTDYVGPCPGCQPCTQRHCSCRTHLKAGDYACPACVGHVRENLREIEDRTGLMPYEAIVRGVNSEAAMLAGPATDPESWSWRKAHLAKTIAWDLLPEDDVHHPRSVLGSWERAFREDYDHDTALEWTLSRSVDYLSGLLTRLARDDGQDFALFAAEVRTCLTHLETVLHDQAQGDRAGVGCFDCGGGLERRLGPKGFEDVWTCKGCRRRYSYAEYNFALRAALEGRTA